MPTMPPEALLAGSYDYRLVALSVLIAMLAPYAALDLAGQVTAAHGCPRFLWLNCGAAVMGLGIWSMHYIGMLAYSFPVEVLYYWRTVVVSLLATVLASGVVLLFVSRKEMGLVCTGIGGVLMGIGIAAMHSIGMAMRLPAICCYSPTFAILSIVLAIVISLWALWLALIFREVASGIPSVPRSIKEPFPSLEVNIDGTFNVLRASIDARVRRVVYATSSSAYGDTDVLLKVETMLPRPRSPYVVQKLMGEQYASVFHSCVGLETFALRFFNVYGERQDTTISYSGVLSLFFKALLERHSPPVVFGDGEQTRDFSYVDDVTALCCAPAAASGLAGKLYNAGNGNRYSLNYVWDLPQKIEGIQLLSHYGPPRGGDVHDSQADTAAARRDLRHNPQYSLEQVCAGPYPGIARS